MKVYLEERRNKVTSLSSASTDTEYPSAKCVYEAIQGGGGEWGEITGDIEDQTDLATALGGKQPTLVSGTNIKTINNNSILGSGNINLDSLPSQSGKSGKYLKTDGTTASWENVSGDSTKEDVSNKVTSLSASSTDTQYPSAKCVYDEIHQTSVNKVYGFHINSNDSNPSTAVTYLLDAVGMTPAYMDFTNNTFNYGSWGDAFFLPKPCMLKSNGERDYYLNPNDYTKKMDGTASDVANTSYDGNAMMEWGDGQHLIWIKFVPDTNNAYSGSVYIANYQADINFTCYPFINSQGTIIPHFYTPIYNGSLVSNKLRSISGQTVIQNKTAQQEIDYAKANYNTADPTWNTEMLCDIQLINALCILISKTLNCEAAFGLGNQNSGSEATLLQTGSMNNKGLFWGKNVSSSSDNSGVKIFGMENYYANQWRRFAGFICDNGNVKVKLTYGREDGSTTDSYNTTGSGYVSVGVAPSGTTGGYIKNSKFTALGMFPAVVSGSASTYYCDGMYFSNSSVYYAFRGGVCDTGSMCGLFCLCLNAPASFTYESIGAAPSCKPLV